MQALPYIVVTREGVAKVYEVGFLYMLWNVHGSGVCIFFGSGSFTGLRSTSLFLGGLWE